MDDFKLINDFFGHAFGNIILKRIANALDYAVSFCGTAFHGDEFALILRREEVERVCSEIHSYFRKDDNININQGAVVFGDKTVPFERLFKTADKALYMSKPTGQETRLSRCYRIIIIWGRGPANVPIISCF